MSKHLAEPRTDDLSLTDVLYALSDETRLRIVELLANAESVPCGGFAIDVPKSSLSYHFRVLVTAGVIERRKVGTAIHNRLRTDDLDARFPGLLGSVLAARRAAESASVDPLLTGSRGRR